MVETEKERSSCGEQSIHNLHKYGTAENYFVCVLWIYDCYLLQRVITHGWWWYSVISITTWPFMCA